MERMQWLTPCSKSTNVPVSQRRPRISSRLTTSPARLASRTSSFSGWGDSLIGAPDLRSCPPSGSSSKGPKRSRFSRGGLDTTAPDLSFDDPAIVADTRQPGQIQRDYFHPRATGLGAVRLSAAGAATKRLQSRRLADQVSFIPKIRSRSLTFGRPGPTSSLFFTHRPHTG